MKDNLEKNNYDDLFLRDVLVGLQAFVKNQLSIVYRSQEQGDYEHVIPVYYKSGADTQFLIDSFLDDIPDLRVHSNTDITPRMVIEFGSWAFNSESFTNPTVWYDVPEVVDEELINKYKQIKWVPISISGTFEFTLDSLFEQFAIWQTFIINQYSYTYFSFEHKMMTLQAFIEHDSDQNNNIVFNKSFTHEERIIMPFTFTIKTAIPIVDNATTSTPPSNMGVTWLYEQNKNKKYTK